jgi:hypothetical protein
MDPHFGHVTVEEFVFLQHGFVSLAEVLYVGEIAKLVASAIRLLYLVIAGV